MNTMYILPKYYTTSVKEQFSFPLVDNNDRQTFDNRGNPLFSTVFITVKYRCCEWLFWKWCKKIT